MGVSLSIKNVPEDVVERLRQRAARHHRSLQGELMSIITDPQVLANDTAEWDRPWPIADIDAIVVEIRASGLSTPDESVRMIREDRDSDHGRR